MRRRNEALKFKRPLPHGNLDEQDKFYTKLFAKQLQSREDDLVDTDELVFGEFMKTDAPCAEYYAQFLYDKNGDSRFHLELLADRWKFLKLQKQQKERRESEKITRKILEDIKSREKPPVSKLQALRFKLRSLLKRNP